FHRRTASQFIRKCAADLKMLVIYRTPPVASPQGKSVIGEHIDNGLSHSGTTLCSVQVFTPLLWTNADSVALSADKWILNRIKIDGQAVCVNGQAACARHSTII